VEIDLTRVLCRLDELKATGCREFRLAGGQEPLQCFVVRCASGVHAYVNRCAHMALPLNLVPDRFLTHDGSMILCTAHGAIFEKSTGYCVSGPCAGRTLASVPVEVIGDYVLLGADVDTAALAAKYD
jgi:nitrite reductase/ring-hydroxylating ferredoxin subunit